MPSSGGLRDQKIVDAVKNGRLSEDVLDTAVERLLHIIFKAVDNYKENAKYDNPPFAFELVLKDLLLESSYLLIMI